MGTEYHFEGKKLLVTDEEIPHLGGSFRVGPKRYKIIKLTPPEEGKKGNIIGELQQIPLFEGESA